MANPAEYRHLLIEPNEEGLQTAAQLLRAGNLVAFPTETVYGLGANALNPTAVSAIFTAKGRPLTDPLIVHVSEPQEADRLVELSAGEKVVFDVLTTAFWPGPLTLIVKASPLIPALVTAQTGFVGVRCPAHPLASALLRACGLPVAAPSANRFGHVSPTKAAHVLADLAEKGVRVLNGESQAAETAQTTIESNVTCEYGIESTVAKVSGADRTIVIFRPGAVSEQRLRRALQAQGAALAGWEVRTVQRQIEMHGTEKQRGEEEAGVGIGSSSCTAANAAVDAVAMGQQAPGQAVTHYAPACPCHIVTTVLNNERASSTAVHSAPPGKQLSISATELHEGTVVIDFGGALHALKLQSPLAYRDLSTEGNFTAAAQRLFDTLRWAEEVEGVSLVLIADVLGSTSKGAEKQEQEQEQELRSGLADRMFRSASGSYVQLELKN